MEPISSLLIPAITETVFGALAEATGLSDWLRQRLGRDPERLAFQSALTQALTVAAHSFPGRDLRYFTETLRDVGGPLLARTLQPAAPWPTPEELTQLWLNHLTIDSAIHYRQEFAAFATLLLDQLNQHIENQQPLQWIVQARRQRSSEEALRRLAETTMQSAATLDALRQVLAQLTGALETILKIGGPYVAGSVNAHNFAGRDLTIKNYFVAGLARLPTDYSVRIENFLFTYLGGNDERVPFGGRQQQLGELNHWLDDPTAPPYYLMVAEAGKGKSALVCRWSAQLATRPDLDVIFVPISIRFQTAAQDVFFGALAARLAQLHEKQTPDLFYKTNTATDWKAVCESYLRRPLPDGKRLVLILDGLDEATDWLAGPELFAVRPPTGLRVLVTARLRVKESDALGWAATLNWEGPRLARKVTLPALDRQGVEEALASMGNPLDWLATQIDIVGKLYYLSEGDPLLVRLYVDELAKKQVQAAFLTPADLDTIQPGLAGFMQKWWEDQRKQWRMQKKDPHAEEERLLPLLSACAVAYGPLLLKDLAALDATHFGAARAVVNRAELLGRWLLGDGERQGYVFAHPRLREFFSGPTWLSTVEHTTWQAKFCDWGERVLVDLNAGTLAPKQAPEYLLRNYAIHLAQNAAPPERFYPLISNGWRKAWEELDVSYSGFLGDVAQAWQRARLAYDANQPGRADALVQQVRSALCRSSVAALGSNMPLQLFVQLVEAGLYTPVQALVMVKFVPDEIRRTELLATLAPHLPEALLGEALSVARAIESEYDRACVLGALAPHLPEALLGEVWSVARAIESEYDRADVLGALAPHLPEALLGEVWSVARAIKSEYDRAYALSEIAPHLPERERVQALEEALAAAQAIEDEADRAYVLAVLAPHLPERERVQVLEDALAAAQAIEHEADRARVLDILGPHLPERERVQALEEVLATARAIWREADRARVLSALAPDLPEALLGEALAAARAIKSEADRADVLGALAPHLPEREQMQALEEALAAAQAIEHEPRRVRMLGALAPHLPEALLREVWSVIRAIESEYDRADVLGALAPHLPEALLGEVLAAARAIERDFYRARVLSALAPHLPEREWMQALEEALVASRSIEDVAGRARVLSALAPHLPERERVQALEEALAAARAIKSEVDRARVLSALAPHLPEREWMQAREEALAAVRAIKSEHDRAKALNVLAPDLPKALLGEVLAAARAIESETDHAHVLTVFVPYLPDALLGEALATVWAIESEYDRARVLIALAPHLPEALLREALSVARAIWHEHDRARVLIALAPHLPEALLREALAAARAIEDEHDRAPVLSALAPHLPEVLLREALAAARSIEDEADCARALSALAPYLPERERVQALEEALAAARAIEDEADYARALSALAPHLPEREQVQALEEALTAARAIESEYDRADVLSALAPHLPEALLGEALSVALAIESGADCARVLSALAPHLPEALLGEVWSVALAIKNEADRAHVLSVLVPHLPEALLREALAAVRALKSGYDHARVLSALAPHLPEALLGEALAAIRAFATEHHHTRVLNVLAPHLPEALLREACSIARAIKSEVDRASALNVLAPHLPERERVQTLEDAWVAARSIESEHDRARVLIALAPHLPEALLGEALAAAQAIESETDHARLLGALALHLPTWAAYQPQHAHLAFAATLYLIAAQSRPEFLSDLNTLMPFILALAGDEAPQAAEGIFHAIQEVCAWWP